MSNKFYVGQDLVSFSDNGKYKPISRVTLMLDDENCVTAGDDTGKELVATCYTATQAMADALLARFKGYEYQAYNVIAANLNPAAELGDGLTADGHYVTISRMDDDGSGYPSASAPGEAEMEDEYPSAGPMEQKFNRKIAETNSRIIKTAEQIRLEIVGLENAHSELELSLDGLSTRIQDAEGNIAALELTTQGFGVSINDLEGDYAELALTLDGLTVTDSSGTTRVKGSSVETTTLYVDAAHITGTLEVNQINMTGAIQWAYLDTDTQEYINEAWLKSDSAQDDAADAVAAVESVTYTYNETTYIDESKIMAGSVIAGALMGGSVYLLARDESISGVMTIANASTAAYALSLESYSGLRLTAAESAYISAGNMGLYMDVSGSYNLVKLVSCDYFHPEGTASYLGHPSNGMWQAVYSYTSAIQTSDRNLKNSIEVLDERYLRFILWLTPKRYKMNNGTSDRYHIGFIAQEVWEGMELFGIDSLEFAGWVRYINEDGTEILMLRYEEFIGLLSLALQSHELRISKLEERL